MVKTLAIILLLTVGTSLADRYSLIRNSDDQILIRGKEFVNATPSDPRTLTAKFGVSKDRRWVPFTPAGVRPAPADPATHRVARQDTVTPTAHTVAWVEVALTADQIKERTKQTRLENLEANVATIAARFKAGDGFGDLTPAQRTQLMRWVVLTLGRDG